jgi:hypothetical protein
MLSPQTLNKKMYLIEKQGIYLKLMEDISGGIVHLGARSLG